MRWMCTLYIFANIHNCGILHFDGIIRVPWDPLRSLEIPWDLLRSLDIPFDILISYDPSRSLLRYLGISCEPLRFLEIPWDLLRSQMLTMLTMLIWHCWANMRQYEAIVDKITRSWMALLILNMVLRYNSAST